jgi:hypothetical protein
MNYWRVREHARFATELGLETSSVFPDDEPQLAAGLPGRRRPRARARASQRCVSAASHAHAATQPELYLQVPCGRTI